MLLSQLRSAWSITYSFDIHEITNLHYSQMVSRVLIINLVSTTHVSFGKGQDTELWDNQFPDSKILGLPVSWRVLALT